ncbi:lipid A biosynthesis lauroyl acyltransferase [Paralimibaculum aggregatum]|uniref:Lipid A biosynthesis lauroyl acyltransferase n=1 Tax=Paralimibaculum aggregatum TaxID=3036245 RepID=A0ABQ6LBX5_9RHOB|nr:hypothetical protein [Limibaculum sp. NKW23]GMG80899.1 lipid A biosynthesis lauroyl acyltransferase [Limibaculum sp. NKW23]
MSGNGKQGGKHSSKRGGNGNGNGGPTRRGPGGRRPRRASQTAAGETGRVAYVHARDRFSVRAGEWVLFSLALGLRWVTWPIGTWTLSNLLAPLGGWVALLVPGFRRRAEDNLAHVWPERSAAERRAILRDAGRSFMRLMLEYGRLDRLVGTAEIEVEGIAHLRETLASGRGAVLVTAHYGNWEAVRIAARRAGHDCGIIYRAFNNRYLDRFTMGLIPLAGEPVLQKGPAGLRELIAHLKRGGAVMILVDQRNSGAPFIDFLGQPAETMTTAAELARRTGAALIPAVGRREVAARRFRAVFEPPVAAARPQDAMAEVNRRIGAWVEAEPGQWFWFHRRWRSTRRSRRD